MDNRNLKVCIICVPVECAFSIAAGRKRIVQLICILKFVFSFFFYYPANKQIQLETERVERNYQEVELINCRNKIKSLGKQARLN